MLQTDVKLTDQFLAQLETEAPRTRRALESIPDGWDGWRPQSSSMSMGRIAALLAGIPFWVERIVQHDAVDLSPLNGPRLGPPPVGTPEERIRAFDAALDRARVALTNTTDEHLRKPWRLLEGGRLVSENPRHLVLRETFIHLANYRSQLNSYLHQCEARVPAMSGAES